MDQESNGEKKAGESGEKPVQDSLVPVDQEEVLPPEVLNALPEELRPVAIRAASFRGPLPPPAMFSSYDETLPGAAERLFQMAEKEQNHRISWENKALKGSNDATTRGQWLGFVMSIIGILVAGYIAIEGATIVGVVIAGGSFVGLFRSLAKILTDKNA